MTAAEYAKQRRDRARENKLCLVCCKRPKLADKSTCEHCTDLKRSWALVSAGAAVARSVSKALRLPDRFNVCCQAHGMHRDGCVSA